MSNPTWMIYGATGYTGRLVAEQAVQRGHRPLLAGRSLGKLARLAERLRLDYVHLRLNESEQLQAALRRVELVYHAAGPYTFTSQPMIAACLATGTHYLDLAGEINAIENTFALHEVARQRGVLLMPGVGFDVIPTDCLARYVAEQVPNALTLDIAFDAGKSGRKVSAGTARSMLTGLVQYGGLVRYAGALEPMPIGSGVRRIHFSHASRAAIPIPWGDLSTAYRTTGIRNITVYMAVPRLLAGMARVGAPFAQTVLRLKPLRVLAHVALEMAFGGPESKLRETAKTYVWARATAPDGNSAEAWMETAQGYQFTALAAVPVVERVLDAPPGALVGALTPAAAFGADFALDIEGTRRLDVLPEVQKGG